MALTLNAYQKYREIYSIYPKTDKDPLGGLYYAVLALCGESGELANKLKKAIRKHAEPDALVLADELGDVLWYVAAVAQELGLDLETIATMNLEKLEERRKADKITG